MQTHVPCARRLLRAPLAGALVCVLSWNGGVCGQTSLLPLDPGEIVVTCHSGYYYNPNNPNGFTVGIIDARDPATNGAVKDVNWAPGMYHGEANPPSDVWNVINLGQVFGVCLDSANPPNIYVTASTVYGEFIDPQNSQNRTFGPGGAGAVYRIDGTSGLISEFNSINTTTSIPNMRPGLGNIAHDERHDQFYVSNFEDGLIYVLDNTGTIVGTYDHGVDGRLANTLAAIPDDTGADWTPFGRRVWGLENFGGRLYYALWNEDPGCDPLSPAFFLHSGGRNCPPNLNTTANEIWSVAINTTTGVIDPSTAQLEVTLPPVDAAAAGSWFERTSNPVSDIIFTPAGDMVMAERVRLNDPGRGVWPNHPGSPWDAHSARTLKATGTSGSWTLSPDNTYRIGWVATNPPTQKSRNCAGGVASDCDGNAWITGDALHFAFPVSAGRYVYGLQRIDSGGNAAATPFATSDSYLIDIDGNTSFGRKTQIGDVELYAPGCNCMDVVTNRFDCPMVAGDPLDLELKITNNSGKDGAVVYLTPTSPAGVTIGDPVINLPTILADGDCTTINTTVTLPTGFDGDKITLYVVLLTDDLEECCAVEICLEVPDCDCMLVESCTLECDPMDPTKYVFHATLINVSPGPIHRVFFQFPNGESAAPPGFNDFTSSPIPVNGTFNVSATICNAVPGSVLCIRISAHDGEFIECCAIEKKIDVPACPTGDDKPDRCIVTRVANCCPPQLTATVTITMCNGSTVTPKTYNFNVLSLTPAPPCFAMLSLGDFTPQNGVLGPVPPGGCASTTITVNCDPLAVGVPQACACYAVVFTDQATGEQHECDGKIQYREDWNIKQLDDPTDLPIGNAVEVRFEVTNLSDPAGVLDFSIEDNSPDGDLDQGTLSLDGLPPGMPVTGLVSGLEVGFTTTVSVVAQFGDQSFVDQLESLYFFADADRDGLRDSMSSTSLRATASGATGGCVADWDGDGVATILDLLEYLSLWFEGDPAGELTGDVPPLVDVLDLLVFLGAWFTGCDG